MTKTSFYSVHRFYKNGQVAKTIDMKGLEGITDLALSKSLYKKMLEEADCNPLEITQNQITYTPNNKDYDLAITTYQRN